MLDFGRKAEANVYYHKGESMSKKVSLRTVRKVLVLASEFGVFIEGFIGELTPKGKELINEHNEKMQKTASEPPPPKL